MQTVLFLLLLWALFGHVFLWVGLANRVHALGIHWKMMKAIGAVCFLCMAAGPIGWIVWAAGLPGDTWSVWDWCSGSLVLQSYTVACWIVAAVTLVRLIHLRTPGKPPVVRLSRRRQVGIEQAAPGADRGADHHFFARLPGNEVLGLELSEWILDVPRLHPALDGLSIVHLSDFHFTGRVGKSYFHEVVRISNSLEPDLVAITGDFVDDVACIDWIPDTVGRLAARYGVYFVFGNHDVRTDIDRLRRTLIASGLIDLGGRWVTAEIRGQAVILAGNEAPWCRPAANLDTCPSRTADGGPLRIVLAHSPDQFRWARGHDVDLVLAGHTHGGQIRIPPLGAILSPTSAGVKYVSGIFYREPTILHVTRGVSGNVPIRLCCPPELALLRLCTTGNVRRAEYAPSSS